VLDLPRLKSAVKDHDVVYANLAGDMKKQAERALWRRCTPP